MDWLNTDLKLLRSFVFYQFAEVVADGKGLVTPVPQARQVAEFDVVQRQDPDDLVIRLNLQIGPFRHAAQVVIERLDVLTQDALLEKTKHSARFLARLALAGKVPLVREDEPCRTYQWKDVEHDRQTQAL